MRWFVLHERKLIFNRGGERKKLYRVSSNELLQLKLRNTRRLKVYENVIFECFVRGLCSIKVWKLFKTHTKSRASMLISFLKAPLGCFDVMCWINIAKSILSIIFTQMNYCITDDLMIPRFNYILCRHSEPRLLQWKLK